MTNINPAAYISFGSRIRKSPFYDSTRKYGAKSFTIYNHMYTIKRSGYDVVKTYDRKLGVHRYRLG